MNFEVFKAHEFLMTHFAFVFMTFGLLASVDTHVLDEVRTKTDHTTTDLTLVGFATQTMFLIVFEGFEHHITDGAFHVIGMAGAMDLIEFLVIEFLNAFHALINGTGGRGR